MATITDLRIDRRKAWQRMRDMLDLADKEKRKFTAAEEETYRRLEAEVDEKAELINAAEVDRDEKLEKVLGATDRRRALDNMAREFEQRVNKRVDLAGPAAEPLKFRDERTGMEVRAWAPEARMHRGDTSAIDSLARIVRAKISADYSADLDKEERAAYMGSDAAGGWLVPQVLGNELIAAARDACPVASRCNVIAMDKLNVTLAGVDSDPTAAVQLEGQTMTEGSITFHKITLSPHRIGTYVVLSKELAQASNAVNVISDALRYGCARALDSAILGYETTGGIPGVKNTAGVHNRAAGGTTYTIDQIIEDYYHLKSHNAPDGISMFYNSDFAESLSKRKDGEGQYILGNSPGGVPDIWGRIARAETNIITTESNQTDVFLGNFRYAYLGLQNNWEIKVSEDSYDGTHNAFTQGKVMVRILGWADVGFGHATWFNYASGVAV